MSNNKKPNNKMKKDVIYHANGENQGTYGPFCFEENFKGDMGEKCSRFVSWDCDIPVEVNRYKRVSVEMPDWMTESDYLRMSVELKYAVGLAGKCVLDMDRRKFGRFTSMPMTMRYLYGYLKGRSSRTAFQSSILVHIDRWLTDDEPKYRHPLSDAQYRAATKFVPMYKAEQISNKLYYSI